MKLIVFILSTGFLLAACSEEFQDIKDFIKESDKGLKGRVEPLPEVKPYEPFAYNAFDLPDPFKPRKIEGPKSAGPNKSQPDLNRRQQALEAYPPEKMMKSIVLPNRWLGLALGAMLYCAGYAADPAPGAGSEDPAQNSIDAIEVATLQGGSVAVKITLKRALANPPAGFSINNPPRIAFDFPNTANALGKNTQQVDKSGLRSINIVQAGGRTRLVMNLARPFGYDTKIDGKYLVVTLQTSETGATVAPSASRFAEARPSDKKHTARDIDFRRGANGEGRVIIDLSDTSTGIDLRQQGKNIVIDLINTSLPTNLERRLDVTDFATPVQTIDAFTDGENVRIVVEPKGLWQQSAYQADNGFTLEVKQVKEEPGRLVQGGKPGYSGEKLSLNFQNVEVRAVLQVIADFTGLNIITSDSVR